MSMKKTLAFILGVAIMMPLFASEVEQPKEDATENSKITVEQILSKLPVKLSGYLQTGWNWSDAGTGTSSFQAKRLRLIADGRVTDKISFRLQIEAFNGIQGGRESTKQKDLQVMDAFATWKIIPQFQIRAGQFYTPMGFENYNISPATLETVDFSNICYRIACRNAISYNYVDYGRDLGIMILGDLFPSDKGFNYLSYDLVLSNGSLPSKDDNNKSKDLIGAITIRPFKHMMIKASYNWGEYSDGTDHYLPMHRFITGAWYNNPKGLNLRAEYGMIKSKQANLDEMSAYVLAGWRFKGGWQPLARWDMYKDNTNPTSPNNYNRILRGLSYEVFKNLRLQANYHYFMYDEQVALERKNANQIQIMGIFRF